ncbi:MAG: IPTL-CTERM sorting domain-containing protein [Thermodesulfobacteriota bacterium]
MITQRRISIFIITLLLGSFIYLAFPQNTFAGSTFTLPPVPGGCCQYDDEGLDVCTEINPGLVCPVLDIGPAVDFVPDRECNFQTGQCEGLARNVPTMSEWGLIAMAGVLGIIGYMILRRRKATA